MPPKKGSSKPKGKSVPVADSSHIVFEDNNKKSKKAKSKDTTQQQNAESSGPPKPTAKQIIGGASWTGKLPVNLLSEHCQRMRWNKPEYSMRQSPGRDGHEKMYRSEVTLSRKDPKTQEVTTVPPFRMPDSLISRSEEPSALEARHFAATYALFRISSMKSMSMALPPKYRDLWKGEFQNLKKADEIENKGWLYDADPFAAQQKRQEIHKAMDKRQADQEKKQEAIAKNPTLALLQTSKGREWEKAPKIDMGSKIRNRIEKLVREIAAWNPYEVKLSKYDAESIVARLSSRGFRVSHVEEAVQYCKDEEEVLEWLLIHVPEDDLPAFALPANYTAGISLVSDDLVKEAQLKRLTSAGYPQDFCAQALTMCEGSEHRAALWLQNTLHTFSEGDLNDDIDSAIEWENEKMALEAIFDDRYKTAAPNECTVKLEGSLVISVRFIIPKAGYPFELPAILIASSKMPAYIKLSATKQVLDFASTNFAGEPMIFNIVEWLESNIQNILDNPTCLMELHLTEKAPTAVAGKLSDMIIPIRNKRTHVDGRTNQTILAAWKDRQASAQHQSMLNVRTKLPAWSKQEQILDAISKSRFTIITGETGSGKSTQVVQYILDETIQKLSGASTNILCTQPRRVAALSLADRVSAERCTKVGDEVGYIIRGEKKTSIATKITFMTTGVLLRRLQTSATMKEALEGISHIFIDEVHERSLDTDFLLALLKDSAKANPKLKIVLMSATLDKDIFMNYFGGQGKVAHVHIEGRTFPVSDIYLEEVLSTTRFNMDLDESSDGSIGKVISAMGSGINYDLISTLVNNIDRELGEKSGGILIFLPGTYEIDRCIRALSQTSHFLALPLHASLLPSEQKQVFPPAPVGKRKIIAATNVAETSITIEDVVAVIDTGRVKETRYDVGNNIVRLEEVWASQAACKQRRGRAGRVRAGKCYKLFTRNIEDRMAAKPLPEIQRVPLEQLCLSVKATGKDRDVAAFLSALITPPEQGAIANALTALHLVGALDDDRLTALGTYLSMIPADLRCAKLIVLGALFDCLEPCLTVASILTVKDPFVSPKDKREKADAAKASFPTQHGDLMLSLSAYEEYATVSQDQPYRKVQAWCSQHFLSINTLRDITSTRTQLIDALKDTNLIPLDYRPPQPSSTQTPSQQSSTSTFSPLLLRALISASLQPQIAIITLPSKKYMQSLSGTKELDAEAKTIKYSIPPPPSSMESSTSSTSTMDNPTPFWPRVFIHPSTPLFHSTPQTYTSPPSTYLSYFSKLATGPTGHQKTYIHGLTPLNTYTQLLFGSHGVKIDTEVPGGGMWSGPFRVRGWARIAVLVGRLRVLLDAELRGAIDGVAFGGESEMERGGVGRRFADSEVVKVVKWLVELNGQDR